MADIRTALGSCANLMQNFEATMGNSTTTAYWRSRSFTRRRFARNDVIQNWILPRVGTSCFPCREQASTTTMAAQSRTICVPCTNIPRTTCPWRGRVLAARNTVIQSVLDADIPANPLLRPRSPGPKRTISPQTSANIFAEKSFKTQSNH